MSGMNLEQVLTNAATGLSAQSVRMNTIASNLANAGNVGSSDAETYHAQYPVFKEIVAGSAVNSTSDEPKAGVQIVGIDHTHKPLDMRYEPNHPMANKDGYIYVSDVNPIAEMTNMISASKDYQANVEVMNTVKSMITQGVNLINSR